MLWPKKRFNKIIRTGYGIGPFVIEPVVTKKNWKTAMAEMIAAHEWKSADWAAAKGCMPIRPFEELDKAITDFSTKLSSYNPEALLERKKVLWEGTQHWDTFLQRAAIRELVLSDFIKMP
jgi:methylglutaconyl-CoA hydratase